MKKLDIIGKKFISKSGLEYVVIREVPELNKGTSYYYEIQFSISKSKKIVEKRNLRFGCVKDYYFHGIYGVACKGNVSSRYPELNRIAFKRWYVMIERCYNKNNIAYRSYGGRGVRVCDRWLCFENFLEDLPKIKGYNENDYMNKKVEIDKDILCRGNKTYSLEKCMFVDKRTNIRNMPSTYRPFVAIDPNGNKYEFFNQTECAERFGMVPRTIGKVLHHQLKHHHGWSFEYIDKE